VKGSLRTAVAGVFVLLLAALFVRLGFWQLDRLEQRRARNAALRAATAQPELTLDAGTLRRIASDPGPFVNRRARVEGVYDPAGEVLLRGRSHELRPGVHVVTPLATDGGMVVLVNRGWVPSPDAATVDPRPYAEPGRRTVAGILQAIPVTENGGAPSWSGPGDARTLTYRRLDLPSLRERSRRPLLPLYLQQLPGPDGAAADLPRRVPLPELSEGNHLSYAVQWFSFAAIAVVGYALLVLRRQDGARAPERGAHSR
jgi:surfeit locus 1 family protein